MALKKMLIHSLKIRKNRESGKRNALFIGVVRRFIKESFFVIYSSLKQGFTCPSGTHSTVTMPFTCPVPPHLGQGIFTRS